MKTQKTYRVVFLAGAEDFDSFEGSEGNGADGFFDSDEAAMLSYLREWDYGDNYGDEVDPKGLVGLYERVYRDGLYTMVYHRGLDYAALYVTIDA